MTEIDLIETTTGTGTETNESESTLATARRQLERAAHHVDVDSGIVERLKYLTRIQRVSIPLRRDDGSLEVFSGFRAQHDDVRGPYKGGIRYHPLSSGGECSRVYRTLDVDDLEMRRDGPSIRRWERRYRCRSERSLRG